MEIDDHVYIYIYIYIYIFILTPRLALAFMLQKRTER
jgi:hypothetical protein